MKVLVNRLWSMLSSHLVIEAINYNWSIRSEYGLFVRLCKYLQINTFIRKGVTLFIDWNSVTPFNFRDILLCLSSSALRSLIKLSEYILKKPMYFDIFISPRYTISIKQFEKILCQGSPNIKSIGTKSGLISLLWSL